MGKLLSSMSSQLMTAFDLARLFLQRYRIVEVDTGHDFLTAGVAYRVYRKSFVVAAGPNAGTLNVAHLVTSMDDVIRIYGVLRSGTTELPFNSYDGTTYLSAHRVAANIVMTSGANLAAYSGHLVVEYTKS